MMRLVNLICLVLFSVSVSAMPALQGLPFSIESDDFTFDYKNGKSIYEGHVSFARGDASAQADRVEVLLTQQKSLEKLIAFGEPVHYKQVSKDGKALLATANKMIYLNNGLLILDGNAKITQSGNVYEANKIEIDTNSQTLRSVSGRTKMLIMPETVKTN